VTTRSAVDDRYLTAREVAVRLGLRPETVLRYFNAGLIPGRRLPGKIRPVRFVWSEVEAAFGGEDRAA
jgi:predicted DNA-binding transcriptional regulator AlpA